MYTEITPMGSSYPASWDGQSSRRKEISRLLYENARPSLTVSDGLFLLNLFKEIVKQGSEYLHYKTRNLLTMINQRNSRISLATLILCLCVGSLVVFSFIQVTPSVPGFSAMDVSNLFEHIEFDDDFFIVSIAGLPITGSNFSKLRSMDLGFQSTFLSPVSPPPKHT